MQVDDPRRVSLLVLAGEAAYEVGGMEEQATSFLEDALSVADRTPHAAELARALRIRSNMLWHRGDTEAAARARAEGLELLEHTPSIQEYVLSYAGRAFDSIIAGNLDEGERWADRAIETAAAVEGGDASYAIGMRGLVHFERGEPDSLDLLRKAADGLAAAGEVGSAAAMFTNLYIAAGELFGEERALEIYEEARDFMERRGLNWRADELQANAIGQMVVSGMWDRVEELAQPLAARLEASQRTYMVPTVLAGLVQVSIGRGSGEVALRVATDAARIASEIGDPQLAIPIRALLAAAQEAAGAPGAVDTLRWFVDGLPDATNRVVSSIIVEAVGVAIAEDDLELARRCLDGIRDDQAGGWPGVVIATAMLREAEDDHAGALEGYRDAVELPSVGVSDRLMAALGAARCLLALGSTEEAGPEIDEALRIANDLRAAPSIAQAEALRAAAAP
jgi:tetratricopeptide (TPR) repeat protein